MSTCLSGDFWPALCMSGVSLPRQEVALPVNRHGDMEADLFVQRNVLPLHCHVDDDDD